MKRVCVLVSLVLLACLLCSSLAGCVRKPEAEVTTEWESKEPFEPSYEMDDEAKKLAARYEEYFENSSLAFSQNQPADEDHFDVEESEGGVVITAYKGDESIIVVPASIGGKAVVALGEKAFADLSVRAVSVPDSVKIIEKGAFSNCESLETLRLPFVGDGAEITHFGHIFGSESYEKHATTVPTSLDMVILGNATVEIGENAFAHCKSLSAIVIPESIESVGEFAFYECRDLVYFDVKNAVGNVGDYAFGYCSSLFSVSFPNAEQIGKGAFYGCNAMRSVTLPFVGESNTENRFLGYIFGAESADYNDEFVPHSLYEVTLEECAEIPDRAFASCAYIGKINICDGVESIGRRAFYSCRSLSEILLPDTVKSISDDAFFGCDNLASAELGEGVESIGMQAFYGCLALRSVSIPENVTEIKASTFALCRSLTAVELNRVKKVGKDAFRGCDSLIAVDCTGIEVAEGNGKLVLTPDDGEE